MRQIFALLIVAACAPTGPTSEIMIFNGQADAIGRELWSFDGSALTLIDDINDGFLGSAPHSSSPGGFTLHDGALYFSAGVNRDGVNGRELWKLTGNGTVELVADINPGPDSSFPATFTPLVHDLYFRANDGTSGLELWKLNASTGDVSLAKDINSGPSGSSPGAFIKFDGDIYFNANDGVDGAELWKVDGATGVISQFADINQGAQGSAPRWFAKLSDGIYFAADDGITGEEPWKADRANGARLIKNLNPLRNVNGPLGSHPSDLTEFDGDLYFNATGTVGPGLKNVVWKFDGRTGQLAPAAEIAGSAGFTGFSGAVYFSGIDSGGGTGRELWRINSNGTVELVSDINAGGDHSNPTNFAAFGGDLYFTANDGVDGAELWRLNANGTLESFDLLPGAEGSDAEVFGVVNGTLVVRAFIDRDNFGGRDPLPAMLASNGAPTSATDFDVIDDGSGTFSPDPLGNSGLIVFQVNQLAP